VYSQTPCVNINKFFGCNSYDSLSRTDLDVHSCNDDRLQSTVTKKGIEFVIASVAATNGDFKVIDPYAIHTISLKSDYQGA